jgi:autotransporter-associated beta strand protein
VVINLGGSLPVNPGTYHLIEYSGAIGGGGFAAFTLGTSANNPRGQFNFGLVNDPGYVDVSVNFTPVIWTGSLSTAWDANDTLPAPMNWSYNGSGTNFQSGDIVQFDNSTASGGTVSINNGNVQVGALLFNNDAGHPYTLTGTNSIGGSGQLIKNGLGSLTIAISNSFSGGTKLAAGTINANAASALGTGALTVNGGTLNSNSLESIASATLNNGLLVANNNNAIGTGTFTINGGVLDTTTTGVFLANGAQKWNGDFTFLGTQSLSMASAAVSLGSSRTVTVIGNTLTVNGVISDGGNGYSLTKAGAGNLTLGGGNTYTGATIVNGGTLQTAAGNSGFGAIGRSSLIVVNSGASIIVSGNDNSFVGFNNSPSRQIQINAGGLIENGIGGNTTQVLGSPLVLNGGTLASAAASALWGSWDLQYGVSTPGNGSTSYITGGNLALYQSGGTVFNIGASDTLIVSAAIDRTQNVPDYGLIKTGDGTLLLTGTNSYTAGTTVNGGTLIATNPQAIQDGTNLAVGDPTLLGMLPAPVLPSAAVPAESSAVASVPEPATWVLLAAGIGCMALWRRRK